MVIRRSEDIPFLDADRDYGHEVDPAVVSLQLQGFEHQTKVHLGTHRVNLAKYTLLVA